jgi:MraZ protein
MLQGGVSGSNPKPLLGTDEATIDEKGRILIGKKKRERLGENFVMALGEVGCLVAYPEETWEKLYAEIMQFSGINQGRQQYTRLMLGTADDELSFDAQGRVVVPSKLRKLARLDKEVVLVGCGDRLEIWDKDEWRQYNEYPDSYGFQRRETIEKAYVQMVAR